MEISAKVENNELYNRRRRRRRERRHRAKTTNSAEQFIEIAATYGEDPVIFSFFRSVRQT